MVSGGSDFIVWEGYVVWERYIVWDGYIVWVNCVHPLAKFYYIFQFTNDYVLVIVIWKEKQFFGQLTLSLKTKFVSL